MSKVLGKAIVDGLPAYLVDEIDPAITDGVQYTDKVEFMRFVKGEEESPSNLFSLDDLKELAAKSENKLKELAKDKITNSNITSSQIKEAGDELFNKIRGVIQDKFTQDQDQYDEEEKEDDIEDLIRGIIIHKNDDGSFDTKHIDSNGVVDELSDEKSTSKSVETLNGLSDFIQSLIDESDQSDGNVENTGDDFIDGLNDSTPSKPQYVYTDNSEVEAFLETIEKLDIIPDDEGTDAARIYLEENIEFDSDKLFNFDGIGSEESRIKSLSYSFFPELDKTQDIAGTKYELYIMMGSWFDEDSSSVHFTFYNATVSVSDNLRGEVNLIQFNKINDFELTKNDIMSISTAEDFISSIHHDLYEKINTENWFDHVNSIELDLYMLKAVSDMYDFIVDFYY